MMLDDKGCGLFVGGLAVFGLIVGLILYWIGIVPWWGPLVGACLPVAGAVLLFFYLIIAWMREGSH